MIHLQFIHLAKSLWNLNNIICGKNFCQGHWVHWRKRSNFCIKIATCVRQILNYFFFVKRYHISLTMKVHQVHYPRKHTAYMYIILYECQTFVNNSQWHTQLWMTSSYKTSQSLCIIGVTHLLIFRFSVQCCNIFTRFLIVCLFDLILYIQVNNISVASGRVFLGWTSTKLRLMWWRQWGSKPWLHLHMTK